MNEFVVTTELESSSRLRRLRQGVFFALIALHILPIWIVPHLITQDGPAHVQNAALLRDLLLGRAPLAATYLKFNPFPNPNWIGHALMAAMVLLRIGPLIAEKLLVTMYVIALPLAVRFAIRSMRPLKENATALAILIFPFIDGLALHKGLYNFSLGLPLYFVTIGLGFRIATSRSAQNIALLCLTLVLLYFAHVVPFGLAVLTLTILSIGRLIRERSGAALIDAAIAFNCTLPGVALSIGYLLRHRTAEPQVRLPFAALITQLVQLDALVSFSTIETHAAEILAAVFGVALLVAGFIALRHARLHRPAILVALLATLVFYLAAPNAGAGGGQVSFRLSLFPFFLAIVWLAAQPLPARWIDTLAAVAAMIALVLLVDRTHSELRISPLLEEYASVAPQIPDGSTLWAEFPADRDATADGWRIAKHIRPFVHANSLIVAGRNVFDLSNYEAATDYFPLQFRDPQFQPDPLGGGAKADYILIWQTTAPNAREQISWALKRERLIRDYVEVARSSHGFATLYRARR